MGSARGEAECGAHLCCSVPLPIGLGVSSGGPPAGGEARPPRAKVEEEEPEGGDRDGARDVVQAAFLPAAIAWEKKLMIVVVVQGPSASFSWY